MKEYEKMTVKELVDELTSLGVTFNKKSRKADLLELLAAKEKSPGHFGAPQLAEDGGDRE